MNRRSLDLVVVIALAGLLIGLTFTRINLAAARVLLALPFVFALPGYALMTAAFPGRVFGVSERALLSLGLSLIVAVLGGLVLNLMPWGLRADSWAVLLGGITIGACIIALIRRGKSGVMDSEWLGVRPRFHELALFGLAALVVVVALSVARLGAIQQPGPGFTQLWILPADNADPNTVRVGVSNMESAPMTYRLQLRMSGSVVGDDVSIDLRPGESWTTTVKLPSRPLGAKTVEALLYRLDAPDAVYRRVVLWHGD